MTEVKLLVLDEDTNDAATLTVDLPEPPLAFDELVEAYDSARANVVDGDKFLARMGPWASRNIWPHVEPYQYPDGDVSVLVTFLDSDPRGDCEMEFYMENGALL